MYSGSMFEGSGVIISDYLQHAAQAADEALALFDDAAHAVASRETRRSEEDTYSALCSQARYADLIVLGQSNPDARTEGALLQDLPEYVALHCGRPVLVVPYTGSYSTLGKRVLIAWNGSVEAARAVAAALPLLQRATRVAVAMFDATETGGEIVRYLERHGVRADVLHTPGPVDIGNAILSCAANIDADLLVMGCYGQSRFREMMLGGASRTVLASMTLPVLMAH
jgi:nucleotide-binding universal stress UspA family protein